MFAKIVVSKKVLKAGTITGAFIGGQVINRGVADMRRAAAMNYVPSSSDKRSKMDTINQVSADLLNTPKDEILVTVQSSITKNEATAVAMTLGSDPTTFDAIIPGNSFTPEERGNLLEKAIDIAQRPDLVEKMQSNLQHIEQTLSALTLPPVVDQTEVARLFPMDSSTSSAYPEIIVPTKVAKKTAFREQAKYIPSADEVKWEALRKQYSCSVCADVLAAPVILPCSHSFCGACVCAVSHAADAIGCPNCRATTAVGTEIFERMLDDKIVAAVNAQFPVDSDVKADWAQRRTDYFSSKIKADTAVLSLDAALQEEILGLEEQQMVNMALFVLVCAIIAGAHYAFNDKK